ncbi:MAG: hypothetical protein ACKVIQ_05780 [Acidimicrobiales bacterium]|jgi:MFS family permease
MRSAATVCVVGLAITATAQGLPSLTLGVAVVGGSGAGIWMTAPVPVTEYVCERRRGLAIGALTSTIGVSNIASGFATSRWRSAEDDDRL